MGQWHNGTRKGLESVGFIVNNKTGSGYLGILRNITNDHVDKEALREYVNKQMDEDEGVFFEYHNGEAVRTDIFDENATCVKMVKTPYTERGSDAPVYAYFTKVFGKRQRWSGVFFASEDKVRDWVNKNIIGVSNLPGCAETLNYKFQSREMYKLTSDAVDKRELENMIQYQIDKGNLACWSYVNDTPERADAFESARTFAVMVDTPYCDRDGNRIHAYFTRKSAGSTAWNGIAFATEEGVRTWFSTHYLGDHIRFTSHRAANNFITKLHETLLPGETWSYKESAERLFPRTKYQILESYLGQIFNKLYADNAPDAEENKNKGKIVFNRNQKFCLFNTGLLTRFAKDIYVIAELSVSAAAGTFTDITSLKIMCGYDQSLLAAHNFAAEELQEKMPGIVEFFDDRRANTGIVYDPTLPVMFSEDKWNHIISENWERFPKEYRRYIERGNLRKVADALETEVRNAEKFAARNYTYVVPQYRHKNRQCIQFLMPIYLDGDYEREPDFALVLNREYGYYKPETILDLSLAYNNARVISQPRNAWLKPENMVEAVETDEE